MLRFTYRAVKGNHTEYVEIVAEDVNKAESYLQRFGWTELDQRSVGDWHSGKPGSDEAGILSRDSEGRVILNNNP